MAGLGVSDQAARGADALPSRISHIIRPWAERTPDAPALAEGERVWRYGELADNVATLKGWLAERGVRPGDRLMIVAENAIALAALVLAASELDAWAVVVNARLSAREVDLIRDHCGARRVLYTTAISPEAEKHALRHGAVIEDVPALGPLGVGPLAADVRPEPVEADGAGQVAALLYTSGTTGAPKGVMLTHRNILFTADISGRLRGFDPADRAYGVLPMAHIVGFAVGLISTLMFGGAVRLAARFDPAATLDALERHGITRLQGVPSMFQKLLEHCALGGITRRPLPALRSIGVSGAPLDLAVKRAVERMFGVTLQNGYGITECAPTIAVTRLDAPRADDAVGPPIPGIETRLIGADGKPVAAGEVGELHVRGPNVMKGYYRAPVLTAAAIDPAGWFNTGDLARAGDGDVLFIVGRSKELIIRSGFNVYPPEVEGVLNAHPDVTQSAVVGRAVPGNEEVVAFVQLRPGARTSALGLSAFVAERLAPYKRPAEIVVLDALPVKSTGKILKAQLAERAARAPAAASA